MNVKVFHLVKRYGQHFALHVPELRIATGEALGLVGNNGAGKTTFLRLTLDLIRPDDGHVLVDGQNVAQETGWKAHIGSYLDESFLRHISVIALLGLISMLLAWPWSVVLARFLARRKYLMAAGFRSS